MPAKNRLKNYIEDGYYHLYNRGVEKRLIFQDKQDYSVFLSYLKEYLLPVDKVSLFQQLSNPKTDSRERDKILKKLKLNNFYGKINLLSYCLMPNHFHFLVKQKNATSIDSFMNSLGTRYTMYFNKKYSRVGSLYQGVYKAVSIISNEQLIELSRYIHKQALSLQGQALEVQPCSYFDYLGQRRTKWVKPQEVLGFFNKRSPNLSYQNFIKSKVEHNPLLKEIALDED